MGDKPLKKMSQQDLKNLFKLFNTAAPAPPKPFNPNHQKDTMSDEQEVNVHFTQFAIIGDGFAPTSRTKKRLGAGVYSLEERMQQVVFVPKGIKTDSLVYLPDSKSEEVIEEIRRFWTLKEVFQKYGFLHKRGVLLYGPPGTGKTCTINLIMADAIKNDSIVLVFDGSFHINTLTAMLHNLRQADPDRPVVVVIEDLERYANNSALLALLDGEDSIDNVVYLATTNLIDAVDSRLKNRPSRFDKLIYVGAPNEKARRVYLESRGVTGEQLNKFAKATKGFTFAYLKELIVTVLCFGNDFDKELARLKNMMAGGLVLTDPNPDADEDDGF